MLISIDPSNGKLLREFTEHTNLEVDKKIADSQKTFLDWKKTTFSHRAKLMQKAADILDAKAEKFGKLMSKEMGKLVSSGIAEAKKCAWVCRYYANNAESFLAKEKVETGSGTSFICFQPIGVILAVMPWNFPFWQVFRFAAPALMAGNGCILKHASNVPGCAVAIEEIFIQAGFPKDIFNTLLIGSKQVDNVIENPVVKAVTLTGSTQAGKAVAKKSGEMLKKCVLELGGSDPYIILEDADLKNAVDSCVTSKLINSGQSCIAAKRFIVVESVRARFEKFFVERMRNQILGNPDDPATTIGPMARIDLRDELHKQVIESISKGAKCILGGKIPEVKGAFYPATILTNVKKGMPAYKDELFGPVAALILVKNEQEAIEVANDTVFGLGASVFTSNLEKGERIATEAIQAGCCFVNDFVRSDPRLPFGGIKESGFGRELSHYGIKEFVNIKSVHIK